jgi:hypothetical protein
MIRSCSAEEAARRIHTVVSHVWMVRTFLKHNELFEDDSERMEIPRELFDFARALETRTEGDTEAYLKMVRKKLPKLRAAAQQLADDESALAAHTNIQQASLSLNGCVEVIDELLAAVQYETKM